MDFDWSENAPHLQTLYRPWSAEDGYPEAAVVAAEARLGTRFPEPLRSFYLSWGGRDDMCRSSEHLLGPGEVFIRSGSVVFCIENQGVLYWGIRPEHFGEYDPPVHFLHDPAVEEDLARLSHTRLSAFLDALTYAHAFAGGAVHGGVSYEGCDDETLATIRGHWRRLTLESHDWGLIPDPNLPRWTLYVSHGQALDCSSYGIWIAAGSAEDLDEIRQILRITWKTSW